MQVNGHLFQQAGSVFSPLGALSASRGFFSTCSGRVTQKPPRTALLQAAFWTASMTQTAFDEGGRAGGRRRDPLSQQGRASGRDSGTGANPQGRQTVILKKFDNPFELWYLCHSNAHKEKAHKRNSVTFMHTYREMLCQKKCVLYSP